MFMTRTILFSAALGLLACGPAVAAPVVFERDTQILAEPRPDAAVRGNVPEGTAAQAGERRGAWVAVRTRAGNGWAPSFNVRYAAKPSAKAQSEGPSPLTGLRSVGGLNVTATMGVRGLEKDDRADSKFNAREVSMLEKNRATEAQAKAAAAASGLRARNVDFIEER